MGDGSKLVVGFLGIVVGMAAGFGLLALVLQRTGGALFDNPALGLLAAAGLVGGGATLMGYLALTAVDAIERRRKRASRKAKKKYSRK